MTQGDLHQRRPAQERTCEVRWIRPGRYGSEIDRWFSRFSQVPETRDDDYLISPRMPGLSIKIRGGASFEVKQYRSRGQHRLVDQAVDSASRRA